MHRIYANWVYGSFLTALLLLVISPILIGDWPLENILTWICLPVYMVHQFEEHDADRFRLYFNRTIAAGNDVLSIADVFYINVIFVWFALVFSMYLAANVSSGWGCIAAALLMVNALIHIAQSLKAKEYNPGLYSAAVLFLPLSIAWLNACRSVTPMQLVLAFSLAITVHGAILVYVRHKLKRLKS